MMAWIRAMFYRLPQPGDVYVFDENKKDPWGEPVHTVEVLDAKMGWVRYAFCGSTFFNDERMQRSCFHYAYRKMSNTQSQRLNEAARKENHVSRMYRQCNIGNA